MDDNCTRPSETIKPRQRRSFGAGLNPNGRPAPRAGEHTPSGGTEVPAQGGNGGSGSNG
jgi:hypothetical protein